MLLTIHRPEDDTTSYVKSITLRCLDSAPGNNYLAVAFDRLIPAQYFAKAAAECGLIPQNYKYNLRLLIFDT